jgi:hypothetical protein
LKKAEGVGGIGKIETINTVSSSYVPVVIDMTELINPQSLSITSSDDSLVTVDKINYDSETGKCKVILNTLDNKSGSAIITVSCLDLGFENKTEFIVNVHNA